MIQGNGMVWIHDDPCTFMAAGAQTQAAGSKRYPELDGSLPQKLQEMQDPMDVQVSMSMQQDVALRTLMFSDF